MRPWWSNVGRMAGTRIDNHLERPSLVTAGVSNTRRSSAHTRICKDSRPVRTSEEDVRYHDRLSELYSSVVQARWLIDRDLKENAHPGWSWLSSPSHQNTRVGVLNNANHEESFLSAG